MRSGGTFAEAARYGILSRKNCVGGVRGCSGVFGGGSCDLGRRLLKLHATGFFRGRTVWAVFALGLWCLVVGCAIRGDVC